MKLPKNYAYWLILFAGLTLCGCATVTKPLPLRNVTKEGTTTIQSSLNVPDLPGTANGTSRSGVVASGDPREPVSSHQSDDETLELTKKSQNPVGDLITVPIESNVNLNSPPVDDEQYVTLIKPVVPMHVSEEWSLITRGLIPLIVPQNLGPLEHSVNTGAGLGDIVTQFYLTPAKPAKLIWGLGPQFSFPTATHDILGSGKYSVGPAAVALSMKGRWVSGALVSHLWSFAGEDNITLRPPNGPTTKVERPEVNQTTVQPFVNYNLRKGWFLSSSPIMTANWEANGGDRFTVPLGGGFGKTFRLGKQPMQWKLTSYYNVVRPDDASNWQVGLTLSFLFPKARPRPAENK